MINKYIILNSNNFLKDDILCECQIFFGIHDTEHSISAQTIPLDIRQCRTLLVFCKCVLCNEEVWQEYTKRSLTLRTRIITRLSKVSSSCVGHSLVIAIQNNEQQNIVDLLLLSLTNSDG